MNENDILKTKSKIDNLLKKKKLLPILSVLIENIEDTTIYIRLDYDKRIDVYRLSWCDISKIMNNKIDEWINTCLVFPYNVDKIKEIIASNGISKDYEDKDKINSKIIINSYLTDYQNNRKEFEFKRYIPKCWDFLADVLQIIFNNMPKHYYYNFQIMVEKLIAPSPGYLFAFDYKHDDIDALFDKEIIERGKKYYQEDRIMFLEKYGDIFYTVVEGSENYLVSIIKNEDTNELQMSCNCPCEFFCKHIYASLLAIKDKKEKKFYKIAYIDDEETMLDRIKNFNYLLCVDIVDDCFVIVEDFSYKFVNILDGKKLRFKIVEDDDNKTLEKKLKKYLKKMKIESK